MDKGKVYLVGAGPGDYELITLKGLRLLKQAEVLIYDRLLNESFLEQAPEACEKIYVGKQAANHALPQEQINELLYQKALEGKTVIRLKGGDPYVFGRGGEEALYLRERGVRVEMVPGITSAIAGPAYAGIPVTHREGASSFHVFTGNFKDEIRGLDFANLAQLEGTLVFLMGFANLAYITEGLLKAGKAAATPAAVISQATTYQQKVVTGTLADLKAKVDSSELVSPAITVIGEVVKCREQLNFWEEKPRVLVLRDLKQSPILAQKLRHNDFEPVICPLIRIQKRELSPESKQALQNIQQFTWLIFTSPNSVRIFGERFKECGGDFRQLAQVKLAVVGRATQEVLAGLGLRADLVPKQQKSQALAQSLFPVLQKTDRILIPRSARADEKLSLALANKCSVQEIKIYDTLLNQEKAEQLQALLAGGQIQYLPFTSASTVESFCQAGGAEYWQKIPCIAIGSATAQKMRELGREPDRIAAESSLDGIIQTLRQIREGN